MCAYSRSSLPLEHNRANQIAWRSYIGYKANNI
jgi:hypothetical protein